MKIRVSYLKSPARADTKFNGVKYRGLARVAGPDEAIDSRRRKPAAFFYASEISDLYFSNASHDMQLWL